MEHSSGSGCATNIKLHLYLGIICLVMAASMCSDEKLSAGDYKLLQIGSNLVEAIYAC